MRWRTIDGQLAALIVVAVAALLVTGGTGWAALRSQLRAADEQREIRSVLSRQQDADMMHDALRADVLAAVIASTDDERAAAASAASDNAARARRAFVENRVAASRGVGGEALRDHLEETDRAFARYSAEAEVIARRLVAGQEVSAEELARFEGDAAEVEELMGGLTAALSEELASVNRSTARSANMARTWTLAATLAALVVVALLAVVVWRSVRTTLRAKASADEESRRLGEQARDDSLRHRFGSELAEAFEMARTEPDALDVVGLASSSFAAQMPTELLMADSSTAHLAVVATNPHSGSPGCPVESPWDCPAVRRGQTLTFADSDAINSCPKLRAHPGGRCAAVCVPVTFMGRPMGVLHATTDVQVPPAAECVRRFETLALQTGTRIGTLRATQQTELQAATDGLTGLLNRRSLESAVRGLLAQGRPFTVAMADLDHFKRLNDTHGHEAGDRALRVFANVLRAATREGDIVARHGGEEFVLVFPELAMLDAVPLLERLREHLAAAIAEGTAPAFTASYGLADSSDGTTLDEILRVTDDRLHNAKALGRDRVVSVSALPSATLG